MDVVVGLAFSVAVVMVDADVDEAPSTHYLPPSANINIKIEVRQYHE